MIGGTPAATIEVAQIDAVLFTATATATAAATPSRRS
jgi:hypothetical protein